jgi:ABC-2 type transport system permease protein
MWWRMAERTAGTIYDIGYRRYEGVRRGRIHVVWTLVVHGLRSIFGFGRTDRAKAIPFILTAMALIPAVGQAWVAASTGNLIRMVTYENYLQQVEFILMLLCAAQAPELVSSDQNSRVLPLYFSRPLRRIDYVTGKVAALALAVFAIGVLGPMIILAGRVFANEQLAVGWAAERPSVPPIIAAAVIAALLFSTVSLAISSFLKGRTRASASVVGFFLVAAAASRILRQALPEAYQDYAVLIDPMQAMSGTSLFLFDGEPARRSLLARVDLPEPIYLATAGAFILVAAGVLVARYRKLQA